MKPKIFNLILDEFSDLISGLILFPFVVVAKTVSALMKSLK